MRTRLYDPPPEVLRRLDRDDRRRIARTVRRGEEVATRREAKVAVEVAEWMTRQRQTTYLELLGTPISLLAVAALLGLGWMTWRSVPGMIGNVVPYLAIMLLVRMGAWFLFRRAPEALEVNRQLAERQRRRR